MALLLFRPAETDTAELRPGTMAHCCSIDGIPRTAATVQDFRAPVLHGTRACILPLGGVAGAATRAKALTEPTTRPGGLRGGVA